MNKTTDTIIQHHQMLDIMRINKHRDITVEELKDKLNISRSTADKIIHTLSGKFGGSAIINRTKIVPDEAYFLGISIGTHHTRVVLLGLDFEPISRNRIESFSQLRFLSTLENYVAEDSETESAFAYAYNNTDKPSRFENIRTTVTCIVSAFLKQTRLSRDGTDVKFPLMGIGFGVAGPVNYDEKTWYSAPRISRKKMKIQDLIGFDNEAECKEMGVFLSLDNNAKSSIISEYQFLQEKTNGTYSSDLALIYIGSGVGSAAIIDRKLLRGSKNLSGELGHINVIMPTQGEEQSNTIEQCLNTDNDYKYYLPYILNIFKCILGIDRFILVGHSVAKNKSLLPALMDQRFKFTVGSTDEYCTAETGRAQPSTAAIGAAIEAYFSMCSYQSDSTSSEIVNLATEISWK